MPVSKWIFQQLRAISQDLLAPQSHACLNRRLVQYAQLTHAAAILNFYKRILNPFVFHVWWNWCQI
jgi:hypothetical protein